LWVILECIKVGKWNGEGTITVRDINNIQCKRELEAHVRNSKSESRCKVTSWHCTGPGVQFTSYTSADILIETGAAQEGALRKRQAEIYFGLNRELLGLLQHPSWLG